MNRCGTALTMELSFEDGNIVVAGFLQQLQHVAVSRNRKRRGDIGQRIQDEVARRHSGVRQSQARLVEGLARYADEIEVDRATPQRSWHAYGHMSASIPSRPPSSSRADSCVRRPAAAFTK